MGPTTDGDALLQVLEKTRRRHFNMAFLPDRTVAVRPNGAGFYVELLNSRDIDRVGLSLIRHEHVASLEAVPSAIVRLRTEPKLADAFVMLGEHLDDDLRRWVLVDERTLRVRTPLGHPVEVVYEAKR